jgi:Plasmid pRiA4b ORF-3-like protein
MASKAVSETPQSWWQLRVELLDVTPAVWRRLLVPGEITLPVLHRTLQASLGWTNSHLHQFLIRGVTYADTPESGPALRHQDEQRIALNEALGRGARCFDYVYDFGDDWHHVIIVEDHFAAQPEPAVIRCIGGENACPPEDVGGVPGYTEFLAAMADPKHKDHKRYLKWAGGRFDPGRCDLPAINRILVEINIA